MEFIYFRWVLRPLNMKCRTQTWPLSCGFDSSVNRALHQYHKGCGFESYSIFPVMLWLQFASFILSLFNSYCWTLTCEQAHLRVMHASDKGQSDLKRCEESEPALISVMCSFLLCQSEVKYHWSKSGKGTKTVNLFCFFISNVYCAYMLACVAGGILCAIAFVLVAKPWKRVAKAWEDWWRVELNSRLPKLVGCFELCVHQCTRISDWLRALKRQSNVNLYLSSFPREKGCLLSNTLFQIERVRSKKCIEGALDSLNIHGESRKIILKEEQERDFGEWCVKWGWLGCMTSTVRDICSFAVLCWVTRPCCRFTRTCLWRALHVVFISGGI